MIIGILLGVSLSFFITSLIFIVTGISGTLKENLITGAVIGTQTLISYSFGVLALSFVAILFCVYSLRKRFKN